MFSGNDIGPKPVFARSTALALRTSIDKLGQTKSLVVCNRQHRAKRVSMRSANKPPCAFAAVGGSPKIRRESARKPLYESNHFHFAHHHALTFSHFTQCPAPPTGAMIGLESHSIMTLNCRLAVDGSIDMAASSLSVRSTIGRPIHFRAHAQLVLAVADPDPSDDSADTGIPPCAKLARRRKKIYVHAPVFCATSWPAKKFPSFAPRHKRFLKTESRLSKARYIVSGAEEARGIFMALNAKGVTP